MTVVPLRHLAEVRSSSVDKKSLPEEVPVVLCNYTDVYYGDRVSPSAELMRATATEAEVDRFKLLIGDSIITKDSEDPHDIGRSAFVEGTADDFVCAYHLAILRPGAETNPRFLTWAVRGREVLGHFTNYASGMTRYGLSVDGIKSAPVHLTSQEDQSRIADFLDDRVARIDRIIAARRQQIALLGDSWTSRLDSRVWSCDTSMPLKHLLVNVTSGPRGWGDLVSDEGTPFVRIGNLSPQGIEMRNSNLVAVQLPEDAEASRAALNCGDVLLSITAAFGEVAVWRGGAGTFSQHVARLRPANPDDSEWIAWVLQSRSVHDQYRLVAYGGTKIGMGLDQVRNLLVPTVSAKERHECAASLSIDWEVFNSSRRAFTRSVDLLAEYKASLITAAVTGELDVTTAGSGIPNA